MIKAVLWDIDGTLLNFKASERVALRNTFLHFGLGELTDDEVETYSGINDRYWKRLERGEMTKPEILKGRFVEFFALKGITFDDYDAFNAQYQYWLSETICFVDRSNELISALKGQVEQYAVTNGARNVQDRKLKKAGLSDLFDGIFISESVGAEKPSTLFFDKVFEQIGDCQKDEIMIVGDSLTSDIKGGNNAGIICCWYNPNGDSVPDGTTVHHIITDLWQVVDIIKGYA